jgi:hypothetical protein
MSALAEREGRKRAYPVKAGAVINPNTPTVLVGGYLTTVDVLTGIAAGVTTFEVDNSLGADGAARAEVVTGEHKFSNAGDITVASVGQTAYFVTDGQVSISDDTATRNTAGKITQVDVNGVWVSVGV